MQVYLDVIKLVYIICSVWMDNKLGILTLLFQLAQQYPDGWLEAGLRTNTPPKIIMGNNIVRGNFSGILELYVRRPNGQKIRVATVTAVSELFQ